MSKTDTPAKVASNDQLGMYPERDHIAQGQYYIRHVDAMTREGLHSKSRIAGELAARDIEIERLRGEVMFLRATMEGATYQLSKARIWGGMEWHYNPLHPMYYKPALDRLREVLDRPNVKLTGNTGAEVVKDA